MANPTIEKQDAVQHWVSQYEMMASMAGNAPATLQELRASAIDQFKELGIPTTRHEEWKYTSLRSLFKRSYTGSFFAPRNLPLDSSAAVKAQFVPNGLDCHLVVLVNGHYNQELSEVHADEVKVSSLKTAWEEQSELVAQYYGQMASHEARAMVSLNTALAQDGVFLHIGKSKTAKLPVYILHLNHIESGNIASNNRLLVIAEDNSEMTVVEDFRRWQGESTFTNYVGEIQVGRDARVKQIVLQDDSTESSLVNFTQVCQDATSNFSSVVISTNGELIRNTIHAAHEGEHIETHLHGLYHLNGEIHVDNHTMVDHKMPNCFSNELYKGVLDGNSTGIFNGKVMVRPDAQKTNAFQSNKNILLSPDATINTKPQLEIWADDVKCSHGATTGQLDEEALFYLRARGVSKTKARALLTYAFAAEVLEAISIAPLREHLEERLRNRLF